MISMNTKYPEIRFSLSAQSRAILVSSLLLLLSAAQLPTSAQNSTDNVPLRPEIDASSAPDQTSPNKQQQQLITQPTAPLTTQPATPSIDNENAKQAATEDFARHTNAARSFAKNPKSGPATGASGVQSTPVFTRDQDNSSGPSSTPTQPAATQTIQLGSPPLQSLVSVNDYLNPFTLDAKSTQSLNLRNALFAGLDQNLDLAISRTKSKQQQAAYYSALGNFLPNPTLGFSEYFAKGRIGLPSAFGSLFGSSTTGTTASTAGATSGHGETVSIRKPFEIMHAGFEFYAYRGGSILFGAREAKHNYKAAQSQEKASVRDTLMTITQNYYNLVLAEAILQIRVQAVRTSEEQLRRNTSRMHSGLATNLDVLQSRTQLSRDKQALVDQQTNRRAAAITLADSLYSDMGEDLMPVETAVKKIRLVDSRLNVSDLLQLAIDNRPELKQYEELRLAAKKAIVVAAANLQPTVLLAANIYGIGPPANIQALNLFSLNVNWKLKGFGTVDAFNVEQARWQARQAGLQQKKELQTVLSQVRNAYIQILDKEKNIDETTNEVASALEELRLAELRKANGLGLNLDVITAQRDYTQALVDKAQALINFDIAQAQLIHDMGLISVDALTSGRLITNSRLGR